MTGKHRHTPEPPEDVEPWNNAAVWFIAGLLTAAALAGLVAWAA